MSLVLTATDLGLRFGSTVALDHVSLRAERGEVVGLLGPNGAGKTSLLRVLLGLLPQATGRVELDGLALADDRPGFLRHVGYLPEQLPLYPELRVAEYLDFRAALRGVAGRSAAIDRALQAVNLLDHRRAPIRTLSKGMQRRVGLADALLASPKLLLLDEPTDGLDPSQRQDALQLIADLAAHSAVIFSTHILSEVETIAHRLCVLQSGRVVASGTTAELLQQGRHFVLEATAADSLVDRLLQIEGVLEVVVLHRDAARERLRISADRDVRPACAALATQHGQLFALGGGGLEALFAQLTTDGARP